MEIKNQIVEKSISLFKVYGIRSNTMDDIAREVGISKKTLYQYIDDKNELIQLVMNTEYAKSERLINQISIKSINPIDGLIHLNFMLIAFLKEINSASVNDLKKHYNAIYLSTRKRFRQLFHQYLLKNIADGKKRNLYRKELNDEVIAQLHSDRIQQMTESKKLRDIQQSTIDMLKELTNYYIRGLVTKKGEELLIKHMNEFNKYLKK